MEETITLVASADRDVVDLIRREIDTYPASQSQVTERRNLDGGVSAAIVVASLVLKTVPRLLDFIEKLLELHKVKSFKVGDMEIQNPSEADLKKFRAALQARYISKGPQR